MRNSKPKTCALALVCVFALGGEWLAVSGQAPLSGVGEVSNFSTREYYGPPFERQMQFRLTSATAKPLAGGAVLLTQMKLETFRENGEPEIVIEAPECLYDSSKRLANSPGRLQVQTGDQRFRVEGQGFLWTASASLLAVSNEVRALVRRDATNSIAAAARAPLEITSHRLDFGMKEQRAVFREEVHGDDPTLGFACDVLTVNASTNGAFDLIVAEGDASMVSKADGRNARAQRAVYTRADERVELSGDTSWKQGRQEGRADRATIGRMDQSFKADGGVALKLPRESLGLGVFFLTATNSPAPATDADSPLVDLFAEHFLSRSNLTVAEGSVRVVDGTNRLSCGKLSVQSPTAQSPEETAVAEQNVVVERGEGRIQADRAVYVKSTDTIEFTGRPQWHLDQIEGQADRVTIRSQQGETHAEGNVDVKVPAGDQGASFLRLFPGQAETNRAPQVIEVFAHEFTTRARQVTFLGEVRAHETPITGSEPRLGSEMLEVQFAADSRRVEHIMASNHVVFEQGTAGVTNGPAAYLRFTARTLTAQPSIQTGRSADFVADGGVEFNERGVMARGEHATYNAAADRVELVGNPMLDSPQGTVTGARVLTWDRSNSLYSATGPYKMEFHPPAVKAGGRK